MRDSIADKLDDTITGHHKANADAPIEVIRLLVRVRARWQIPSRSLPAAAVRRVRHGV